MRPGAMLLTLIAAGCLWAFVYVLRHLLKGGRSQTWVVFAVVSIVAGALLAALTPVLYSPRYANAAAQIVSLSLLFGLPSVPLALVTAFLGARSSSRQRVERRRDRAGDAVRAWREKKGKAPGDNPASAPEAEAAGDRNGDT